MYRRKGISIAESMIYGTHLYVLRSVRMNKLLIRTEEKPWISKLELIRRLTKHI